MKRLAVILAVSLLFGAVVNVVVAWGCLLRRPHFGPAFLSTSESGGTWELQVPSTWPPAPKGYWEQRGIGWRMRTNTSESVGFSINYGKPHVSFRAHVWRCGWPLYSLTSVIVTQDITGKSEPSPYHGNKLAFGILIPDAILKLSNWDPPCLPTKPDPLGFTINTLFYGAILAVPLLAARPARRFLRLHAGLCPACKYPIGGSPVCSECGRALPTRRQPA